MSEEPFYTSFPGARQPPPPSASLRPGSELRHSHSMSEVKKEKTVGCQPPAWPSPPALPTRSVSRPPQESRTQTQSREGRHGCSVTGRDVGLSPRSPLRATFGEPHAARCLWEPPLPGRGCSTDQSPPELAKWVPTRKQDQIGKSLLPPVRVPLPRLRQDLRARRVGGGLSFCQVCSLTTRQRQPPGFF